ncbi:hypothetical protein BCD49_06030 [Pseudofrankia sp. EUN1h]|nr:hypothetical protein BCD49_06030 [Pseudofrankia sp. EUN1h]
MCCAGPLLAVLGAVSAGATVAAVWVPALAVVAVVAAAMLAGAAVVRRRRLVACRTAPGPVDLGLPTPRTIGMRREPSHGESHTAARRGRDGVSGS